MPTTNKVENLKINILTKEQFNNATKDSNQIYMITDDDQSDACDVSSVNGKVGNVVLNANDVGALSENAIRIGDETITDDTKLYIDVNDDEIELVTEDELTELKNDLADVDAKSIIYEFEPLSEEALFDVKYNGKLCCFSKIELSDVLTGLDTEVLDGISYCYTIRTGSNGKTSYWYFYDYGAYCEFHGGFDGKVNYEFSFSDSEIDNHEDRIAALEESQSSRISDVQINGASIVMDGVANLPIASKSNLGVVKQRTTGNGTTITADGYIITNPAAKSQIDSRVPGFTFDQTNNNRNVISPAILDYAVQAAMCDGIGENWTIEQQLAAKARLGVNKYELIANLNIEEDVTSWSVDKDMNGEPFTLKSFILYMYYPKATTNSGYSFLNIYDEAGKMQRTGVYTSLPLPSASYWRVAYVEVDCESKIERFGLRDNTNCIMQINQVVNYIDNALNYNVCKIAVENGSATVVATAGTIIKVYGVRL